MLPAEYPYTYILSSIKLLIIDLSVLVPGGEQKGLKYVEPHPINAANIKHY